MLHFIVWILAIYDDMLDKMRYLTIYYPNQDMVLTKICVLWRHPQFVWFLFRMWCVVLHTNILDIPIITVHVLLFLIRSFVVWSNTWHRHCYTTSTWVYDWPHFERVVPYYIVTYDSDSSCFEDTLRYTLYGRKLLRSACTCLQDTSCRNEK